MRFKVVNIGCKVNRVEVDAAAAQLMAQGALPAGDAPADIVVVNTCTVTAEADKKTRKAVRQALKANPSAQLLVTGCAAVMNPAWFEELDARVHVVAKPDIPAKAWELAGEPAAGGVGRSSMLRQSSLGGNVHWAFPVAAEPRVEPRPAPLAAGSAANSPMVDAHETQALRAGAGFRTRVGVKAQDGCNNACTFCIVHVARGESRSVPFDEVLADARAHARAGVRELVLTGINLGAYADAGRGLADLLEALLEACPGARLRIGSVEPRDVDDALVALMAASDGCICRHLHLPLQSGSSRVLAQMNRPYDAGFFLDLVARLRAAMPQLALSTDIIVGFPGETEADFQATLDVARRAAFNKIHVFRYSRREGTPAAARPDQVPAAVSAERSHRLQELSRQLGLEDARRRLGTSERVLVEAAGRGTTESYLPVRWASGGPRPGELVRVPLDNLSEDGIFLA